MGGGAKYFTFANGSLMFQAQKKKSASWIDANNFTSYQSGLFIDVVTYIISLTDAHLDVCGFEGSMCIDLVLFRLKK